MKILIDGIEYTNKLASGFVIKETLTEELDSATIILNNLQKTEFKPFTSVKIETEDKTYYFDINTTQETLISTFNSNYQYILSLISQTKRLERIILPNLKITKSLGKETPTIYDYIKNVILKYINRQLNDVEISDELATLTSNVHCAEATFNTPNAKEVLNYLLNTIQNNPCLIKLENNKLKYVSLSSEKEEFKTSDYNIVSIEDYSQMNDYADNTIVDAKNILSDKYSITPILNARASEGYKITSDNMIFIVPNAKIEKINNLFLYFDFEIDGTQYTDVEIDVTEFLLEDTLYNQQKSKLIILDNNPTDKVCYFHFKQNDNKIYPPEEWKNGFYRSLTYILAKKYNVQINKVGIVTNDFWKKVKYKVSYYTLNDIRVKSYKNRNENNLSLNVGQEQEYAKYENLTKQLNEQINRLGNAYKVIKGITTKDKIPALNSVYEGEYYMASIEYSYLNDYVIFNAEFIKNFIKRNSYIGAFYRQRYNQLLYDSICREELIEFNTSLDFEDITSHPYCVSLAKFYKEIYTNFMGYDATQQWVNAIYIETYDENNEKIANFLLNADTYNGAKQITISGMCQDNYSVGMQNGYNDMAQSTQAYYPYVDKHGEFTGYIAMLLTQVDKVNANKYPEFDIEDNDDSEAFGTTLTINQNKIYKDNGEQIKFTYQFNFFSGDEKIIVGDMIGYVNPLITKKTIKVRFSNTYKINERYPNIDFMIDDPTATLTYSGNKLIVNSTNVSGSVSWCICTNDNELIIGVNSNRNFVYFNKS